MDKKHIWLELGDRTPLFVCDSCDDECNCHPASDLQLNGEKLICCNCADDLTEEEFNNLVKFVPQRELELAEARAEVGIIEHDANVLIADLKAEIERLHTECNKIDTECNGLALQLKEARAEVGHKNKLIEQMIDAIGDALRHAEPPQHDIRGCMRANCWWCYMIRARDAALSAAERGE
jgi:hypothetical protein